MTTEEQHLLLHKAEYEGFDYCFTDYSDWKEIKDEKFQKLLKTYKEAKINLQNYIEQ